MKTAIIALTKNGAKTAVRIKEAFGGDVFIKHTTDAADARDSQIFTMTLKDLVEDIFNKYDAFILIMATGIAFRTFAPYIKSKDIDPALVVLDEKGQFSISLLSGHLGGANQLTLEIADKIGATPVITTATDVNKKIAFDMVAKENNCAIENLNITQFISSSLVNGGKVSLLCHYPILGEIPNEIIDYKKEQLENTVVISNKILDLPQNHVLYLRPKNLILGIGCRKNTPFITIEEAFLEFMEQKQYSALSIKAIASIDLKKDENGILSLKEKYNLPFLTFSSVELNKFTVEEDGSKFVEKTTGTASVSQSAALAGSKSGKTIVKKTICQGITFSLAEEITEIRI